MACVCVHGAHSACLTLRLHGRQPACVHRTFQASILEWRVLTLCTLSLKPGRARRIRGWRGLRSRALVSPPSRGGSRAVSSLPGLTPRTPPGRSGEAAAFQVELSDGYRTK